MPKERPPFVTSDRPVDLARDHVLKNPAAPMTLVEYGSYACLTAMRHTRSSPVSATDSATGCATSSDSAPANLQRRGRALVAAQREGLAQIAGCGCLVGRSQERTQE
jgi:hypothetical protein